MSDPAIEAAERAGGGVSSMCHLVAVGAARTALKPIRELHRCHEHLGMCVECEGEWPCATARLIYTSEELA